MSGRVFQGVIHQMKDAIGRTIGVLDENGAVIACSDLMKIGETRQAVKEELIYSAESVIYQSIFSASVPCVHSTALRQSHMAFINKQQKILRKIVK